MAATVGDKELANVVEALTALNTARASLVKTHKGLGRIAAALNIPTRMDGGTKIEEEQGGAADLRIAS
jgi:hypothetical protein